MRYFVAVAEELHFGHAAERLNLAQQPLSAAIKRLEAQIGTPLLRRTSRRVELTPAGTVYLREVRDILQRTATAAEAARRAARGQTGELSVGYKSQTLSNVLPLAVQQFGAQFPEVQLRLHEYTSAGVEAALARRDVQVGLLCPPLGDHTLITETVLREPLVLALPAGHRLTSLVRVPFQALRREALIGCHRELQPAVYDAIQQRFREAGVAPRVVQEVATEAALVGLVAAGMGAALVSASQGRVPVDGVLYRVLDGPPIEIDLVAAWHREAPSPLIEAFVALVHQAGAGLSNAAPRPSAVSRRVTPAPAQ